VAYEKKREENTKETFHMQFTLHPEKEVANFIFRDRSGFTVPRHLLALYSNHNGPKVLEEESALWNNLLAGLRVSTEVSQPVLFILIPFRIWYH